VKNANADTEGWAGFGHGKGVAVLWFSCTDSRWAGLFGKGRMASFAGRRFPSLMFNVSSLRLSKDQCGPNGGSRVAFAQHGNSIA
jgi:hypothetical protein